MATRKRRTTILLIAAVLCIVYVGSYLWLSRRAYTKWTLEDTFYFADPSSESGWRVHSLLYGIYYPLIKVDNALGTGRESGSQPLYDLE
jgi:hypothetical protein